MKFIIQYKNQYIKVKANEKYFYIGKSYRFTSIKNMKNIINKIKEYIYMYIKYVPYNNNPKYHKDSANKIKIINGTIMFIMFIFCTIGMLKDCYL